MVILTMPCPSVIGRGLVLSAHVVDISNDCYRGFPAFARFLPAA